MYLKIKEGVLKESANGNCTMKKYIELNNEIFKVRHFKGELYPIKEVRTLTDCYARPSEAKKEVYKQWFNWYLTVDSPDYQIVKMTIQSYNVNMFTIRMDVFDTKTYEFIGYIYITKTRHEFWLA